MELTILMPCLNEAETLATCIQKAKKALMQLGIKGEVLIADNGSSDGSVDIALNEGARVVHVDLKGYGSALKHGICAAKGKFVIMGDADDSYDFSSLDCFLGKLREGYHLVMGNRFLGGIEPGAMPLLHKYLGNPVLSSIGRLFFNVPARDFHCGLRGFNREAILQLNLTTSGMEFASEMVVRASLSNYSICEVPTTLKPDGRSRPPHLRSWRDGWRHLRFLLLFAPNWLFMFPGLLLFISGTVGVLLLSDDAIRIQNIVFDIHTLLYCSVASVVGLQMIIFSIFAHLIGAKLGVLPQLTGFNAWLFKYFTLERGIIISIILFVSGVICAFLAILEWQNLGFGSLIASHVMRMVIPSSLLMLFGTTLFLGSFFIAFVALSTEGFCKEGRDEFSIGQK